MVSNMVSSYASCFIYLSNFTVHDCLYSLILLMALLAVGPLQLTACIRTSKEESYPVIPHEMTLSQLTAISRQVYVSQICASQTVHC
jgi:hypothetical protein